MTCFYFFILNILKLVSGEVPQEGVISKKSGLIFEKRLIEKHLETSSSCPVTRDELSLDDLISIKSFIILIYEYIL